MIPKCEFGDCKGLSVVTMSFNNHGVNACSEHKIPVYEMIKALSMEWTEMRADLVLKFFKAVAKGGK